MNRKAKGSRRERQARNILEKDGYLVTKAGASLGAFDIIAIKPGDVRLVQVKSNRPPPRAERRTLLELAAQLCTQAVIRVEHWVFKDGLSAPLVKTYLS